MLEMRGLRRQSLTFLAGSHHAQPLPARSTWGSVFSSVKWAEHHLRPKTEMRAHAGARRPQQRNLPPPLPSPTSAPQTGGRRPGGALALDCLGPSASPWGGTTSPDHRQVHHPPRSGASRAGCRPDPGLGPGGTAPHSGWLAPEKHEPGQSTRCRAGATRWPWDRGGALGEDSEGFWRPEDQGVGRGSQGKGRRSGELAGTAGGTQYALSECLLGD